MWSWRNSKSWLYSACVKILIVGSCTGDKDTTGFSSVLSRREVDKMRLSGSLKSRSQSGRSARDLYKGQQHQQMFNGIDLLRKKYGVDICTVKIVSAAYGLVAETQRLLPYEATFKEKGINPRKRGQELGIASDIQRSMVGFSLIFFLLGKEYLKSIHTPIIPCPDQRLIFFAPPNSSLPAEYPFLVPITSKGSGNIAIKGRAFKWLATGMCMTSKKPEYLMSNTTERIKTLIELGQSA